MNVKEFRTNMLASLNAFQQEWEAHPDYPQELHIEDWYEQFLSYMSLSEGIEPC